MENSKEKNNNNLINKKDNLISKKSQKTSSTSKENSKKVINKNTVKKESSKAKSAKNTSTMSTRNVAKKTTKKVDENNSIKQVTKKTTTTLEYYDLPLSYNKTVVKLLAQTPNCLFVYWEISQEDVESFKKQFGDNFFYNTKPYLKIINETMNYSFDVEINDYANSWYININDSSSKYKIELIRKVIDNKELKVHNKNSENEEISTNKKYTIKNQEVLIGTSNNMDSPNDHVLLEKLKDSVIFKNIRSNEKTEKQISSHISKLNINKIYEDYVLNNNEGNKKYIDIPSSNSSYFK